MWVKKQQLEADMKQLTGSKLGKEYGKAIYYHSVNLNSIQSLSCGILDWMNHNQLWKVLQVMGMPDHVICLLRNLYAHHEATVRTRHRTTD